MNTELSITGMKHLRDSYARRARMYNKLIWQARKRGEVSGLCGFMSLRNNAMKKARYFQKVLEEMSSQ